MLEKLFQLSRFGTDSKTEITAGITTFLTMAYIIFVNPEMLEKAGMDQGAVFVGTCVAAAIGCFIMGFWANLPVAMAPGMGLNAFFTYGVVLGMGHAWQTALGAVFLSGIIFFLLSTYQIGRLQAAHSGTSLRGLVVLFVNSIIIKTQSV